VSVPDGSIMEMAAYLRRCAATLAAQPAGRLIDGIVVFADPPGLSAAAPTDSR
jgi:hypothetical protein